MLIVWQTMKAVLTFSSLLLLKNDALVFVQTVTLLLRGLEKSTVPTV